MDTKSAAGPAPAESASAEVEVKPQVPVKLDTSSLPEATKADISAFEKAVLEAKTPAQLQAATDMMRAFKPVHLAQKPAEEAAVEETPEGEPAADEAKPAEGAADEAATGDEEKEGEAGTEETPAADDDAKDEDDAGDDPIESTKAKKLRLQLPEDDEVGRLAATYMRRNRDWTMKQAMDAAENKLGVKAKKDDAADEAPVNPGMPATVEATNSQIAAFRAEKKAAATALETEKVAELDDKIADLFEHRRDLQQQGQNRDAQAARKYNEDFAESETKARSLYEFMDKPESPAYKRMVEIDRQLEANEDPLYRSPDKPRKVAQMVAAEMNIAPRAPKAPEKKPVVAPGKPATPGAPDPKAAPGKKQMLPGGGSKTIPPKQQTGPDARIAAANPHSADFKALQKSLGITT